MMDYRQQKVKLKKPTGDWQLGMLIRICVPWKWSSFLRDEKSVRFLVDYFFLFCFNWRFNTHTSQDITCDRHLCVLLKVRA